MNYVATKWIAPPPHPTLPLDEIHIWRAHVGLADHSIEALQSVLSGDELERANRFVFEKDRRGFIVARGLLRQILGRYLGVSPAEIEFSYGPKGKPELSTPSSLCFNLSHSGSLVLYAVGINRKVGIDIEQIRSNVEYKQVAQRCFSPLECAMLDSVPDDLVPHAFFNCWTRKEAYIKAIGEGLSFPLDCFDVSLIPGETATLIDIRASQQKVSQWSMHELFPGAEYAAALVVEGSGSHPQFWQWPIGDSL